MNKLIFILVSVAALVFFLVSTSPVYTSSGPIIVENHGVPTVVRMVTLEDGTKCAVLIGYRKGGIDCDW